MLQQLQDASVWLPVAAEDARGQLYELSAYCDRVALCRKNVSCNSVSLR
ncbi:MAG: hypothetical protein ACLVJ6_00655 [Merdibacter sp.]